MEVVLFFVVVLFILALTLNKKIHKYNGYLYLTAMFISVFSLTLNHGNIVDLGFLPFSFFIVIMYTGAFNKSTIKKKLISVRAEYAIIGGILLLPHAWGYFEFYILELELWNNGASFYIGIIAFIIMIPLFLTSFQIIRRKMGYKLWKKLHKISYLFYTSIGLHLILLRNENMLNYLVIFGVYFALKISFILQKYSNLNAKKISKVIA